MKQQSSQPKKFEEKLQKYLANFGFANRRNVADLIKESVIRVNSKKCNVNTLVKTGDVVSVDGEEHIIDLNPEVELLIYHKPWARFALQSHEN
jgi:16S rRNA U516 pseudouridylate synthase RsuA-like enzyme